LPYLLPLDRRNAAVGAGSPIAASQSQLAQIQGRAAPARSTLPFVTAPWDPGGHLPRLNHGEFDARRDAGADRFCKICRGRGEGYMRIGDFLNRLSGVKSQKGGWRARCPGHEDHGLSLIVKEGDDGSVLFECLVGCPADAISSAISPQRAVREPEDTRRADEGAVAAREIPTAEDIFDRPYPPAPPLPPAWEGDSIAVELADRECARLLVNCLFDPPIIDEEIERHARQRGLSFEAAEIEIRRARRG
jgi:hypothetical protein